MLYNIALGKLRYFGTPSWVPDVRTHLPKSFSRLTHLRLLSITHYFLLSPKQKKPASFCNILCPADGGSLDQESHGPATFWKSAKRLGNVQKTQIRQHSILSSKDNCLMKRNIFPTHLNVDTFLVSANEHMTLMSNFMIPLIHAESQGHAQATLKEDHFRNISSKVT